MSESLHKNQLNMFDDLEEGNVLPVIGRFSEVKNLMHLKCCLLKHLNSRVLVCSESVAGAGVGKSTFNFCVMESLQILRILPKLRNFIRIINMVCLRCT